MDEREREGGFDPASGALALVTAMVAQQERKVREFGARRVPGITLDDLLSPDDVPALRADPDFLYEDGILAGLLSCEAALRALFAEHLPGPDGPGPPP